MENANEKVVKKFISESPKLNFWVGLIAGVAIVAIVGFVGLILTRDKNPQVVESNTNAQVAGEQQQAQPVNLEITDQDHVLGNKAAKVKIFEFSDFQCPYCARHHETLQQLVKDYGDKIAWVFKQFPIASHPLGMPGAVASECAGEQGKFWEMSDKIFTNQDTLTTDSFEKFAKELSLDVEKYKTCVKEDKYREKILSDYNAGIDAGVQGTPTNFINGQAVPGAVPLEDMKGIIDGLLK